MALSRKKYFCASCSMQIKTSTDEFIRCLSCGTVNQVVKIKKARITRIAPEETRPDIELQWEKHDKELTDTFIALIQAIHYYGGPVAVQMVRDGIDLMIGRPRYDPREIPMAKDGSRKLNQQWSGDSKPRQLKFSSPEEFNQ
jgi:DNA-directed RNA polymerase subunit RPC12/RpoP